MRSAQRHARIEKIKRFSLFGGILIKIILPVFLVVAVFIFLRVSTRYWNGTDKITVAFKLDNGDPAITILDPKLGEVTTFVIPGDTQVNVARNYGTLRIKNVWQLGINEKIRGRLLAETITQNFLFPVYLWSDSNAASLGTGNIGGILHFIFAPNSTNIPFGDRVSMGIFSIRTQEQGRSSLDLGKSQFLTKQKLNDGLPGYILSGPVSARLTVYFSDNDIASKNLRINLEDATGKPGVAEKVGQIVEVMGGKIVAINKQLPDGGDCTVLGNDRETVKKVANLFSCKIGKGDSDSDLEIDLGASFAKRF